MVFIPGGEFLRGRSHALPDDDLKWWPTLMKDDRPVRPIRIDPFYLDEYEVTNGQYAEFVKPPDIARPITGRRAKSRKARNIPGRGLELGRRLGLCQMGRQAASRPKPNGSAPAAASWKARSIPGATASRPRKTPASTRSMVRVRWRKFKASYFGLYDIVGNVWEWCSDWYDRRLLSRRLQPSNPKGPDHGMYRVIRGGSWADIEKYLTCAYRSWARPHERSPNIGFRCAK